MKVLILDVEEDILEILCYNFSKAGFEVLGIHNEEDLLTQARLGMPEVVVLGNTWQEHSGLRDQLRQIPGLGECLLVYLHTHLPPKKRPLPNELYIQTPVKPGRIIKQVQRRLFQKQLQGPEIPNGTPSPGGT
ncbi:MAG: hypothetical protein D6730_10210 [Bacteroidetes bacterium]|nr:MAG: hypothetical protein D6730_10210 [Bacteroidota bacterium]